MGEQAGESHIQPYMHPVRSVEDRFFVTRGQLLQTHVAGWLQPELFLMVPG